MLERLIPALTGVTDAFELLLIEDGSDDGSWRVIEAAAAHDARVRGVRLSRNYGQQNALLCGIRAARYDVILTMDDDLQHPVAAIGPLLAALVPDVDIVYGAFATARHGTMRVFGSRLTRLALAGAMGAQAARHVSALRVFRTRLRDGFADYRGPSVSIDVLLSWTTSRVAAVPVQHAPRLHGCSGYTAGALLRHALDLVTGFSIWPLQVASVIGFVFVVFGAAALLWVLVNYAVQGNAVPGFAFLASLVTIFSGAQLFALGIFGEYLARIHLRGSRRPAYLVRSVTGPERTVLDTNNAP